MRAIAGTAAARQLTREHYALTLRHWVRGLEACRDALLQVVPEATYRIWLLYMAGCAAAFQRVDIGVYQTPLSRPDRGKSRLPLATRDWYDSDLIGPPGMPMR